MDRLTSIEAFRQVVESGSFVAAAGRLDISPAMVSKHVLHAEQRLGVQLLNRNSRALSLTGAGRVYFQRCTTVLDDLQATERELRSLGSVPRGTLRITAPTFAACYRLAGLLAKFRNLCPEVLIDMSFEDRYVDLVDEGCDLALRIISAPGCMPAGVIARPIRPVTFFLAASREYVGRRGAPQSPEELAEHHYIAVGNLNSLRLRGSHGEVAVPLRVALRCRSMHGAANAIAAGIGIGPLLPGLLAEDPPFKEILTPILPECPLREATLHVVYASRRFVPPKIRAFADFMVEALAGIPEAKSLHRRKQGWHERRPSTPFRCAGRPKGKLVVPQPSVDRVLGLQR